MRTDFVDDKANGDIGDGARDWRRQEAKGRLRSAELLDVLEVESEKGFERVEGSPGQEDGEADCCKDSVVP